MHLRNRVLNKSILGSFKISYIKRIFVVTFCGVIILLRIKMKCIAYHAETKTETTTKCNSKKKINSSLTTKARLKHKTNK